MSFSHLSEFVANHYLLSTTFLVLVGLFFAMEARRGGRALSCREMTAQLNAEKAVLVDVRPHKEFATGYIAGSLNIPAENLEKRMVELEKFKDKTLIVVDASGLSSGAICAKLTKAGYQCSRLEGGIASWRGDNLPVVK